jgi:hypothetical protein
MTLLKKLHDFIKNRANIFPTISLCYPKIKIEEESNKPYFVVATTFNPRGEATIKLYAEDVKSKPAHYKKQFSQDDWSLIQYNLGGLESLQLCGTYQIVNLDFENMSIVVRNRRDMKQETWDITTTITKKRYLNLDKQSILELGIFYQKIKASDIVKVKIKQEVEKQIMEKLYIDPLDKMQLKQPKCHLKLVKGGNYK